MLCSRRQPDGSRMMPQMVSPRHYAQVPWPRTGRPTFATASVDTVRTASTTTPAAIAVLLVTPWMLAVMMMALASGQDIVDHEPGPWRLQHGHRVSLHRYRHAAASAGDIR